ncbi:MAG: PilW family protein [Nitrosomonadales bacterium]|nr:PilW family protein [Nitrosomonadales bacterium]
MSPIIQNRHRNSGFSLVEIMVGMVIGLLSTIIVMQVFATFEGQKRTTTGGSDAQTNGGVSLYIIERDIRMSGYGLGEATGCALKRSFNNAALADLMLAPATIVDGAGGSTDSITVLSGNKSSWSLPVRVIAIHNQADTQINVSATLGMSQGDLLIAYEGSTPPNCTLFQVDNADPVLNPVIHAAGSWNGNTAIFPATFSTDALLMNVGSLLSHTYSVDANNNLVLTDYISATNTNNSQIISSDVASLQAQYGFDTRAGVQTDSQVDTWSAAMIDADASGTVGDAGDVNRIYAIRFAIVARNGLMEKPNPATGVCDTTTVGPSWAGGVINLAADANWMCYRYKTFETIVPLRNMLWRNS